MPSLPPIGYGPVPLDPSSTQGSSGATDSSQTTGVTPETAVPASIPGAGITDGFADPGNTVGPAPVPGTAPGAYLPSASTGALWYTPGAAPDAGGQGISRAEQARAILTQLAAVRAAQQAQGQNVPGASGHPGAQGPLGPQGAQGAQGPLGVQGAQDPQSAQNVPGQDPTVGQEPFADGQMGEDPMGQMADGASGPQTLPTRDIVSGALNGQSEEAQSQIRSKEDPLVQDLTDVEYQLYTKLAAEDVEAADKFLLQQKLSKISELASLLSNIAKSRHDASMAIISNMR